MTHLIAIDQGTTSTRAIVFDDKLAPVASAQQELRQIYPQPGWVEHDPEEIWSSVVATVRGAMAKAGVAAKDVAGIGITNQRETTIVWDRVNGKPIHNAIVWQDRRTADACAALRAAGHEPAVADKTGLLLDPYFSATKIGWLLDHVRRARRGRAGPACLRHGGFVPAVAADRRQGPRHRRHQRLAHAAVRYRPRRLGSGPDAPVRRSGRAAAGGARLRRGFRRDRGPSCSAARSASSASPATSRPPPSGRPAFRPA